MPALPISGIIDFSNPFPATAKVVRSFLTFVHERTEREDQGPEAFADFETGSRLA